MRFKYAVRHLKCRKEFLIREKLARAFAARKKYKFWSEVRQLNQSCAPSIDGTSNIQQIADLFSSKFAGILNKHSSSPLNPLLSQIQSSLSSSMFQDLYFTDDDVTEAIGLLKPKKSGAGCVTSEHLRFSHSVIALPLSQLFTSIVRHGYMPALLRDSILVPVPKSNKDGSVSHNYCPIALSSTLSKVLEWLILYYSEFFVSSHLQFGLHSSTSLCTGVVKNVMSHYIQHGSSVYGFFLDASKAFDLVDHTILFRKLLDRGLPLLVVCFCYLGIALKNVMFSGVPVSLHHLGFLMEFVRVVFFLLSSLLFIWMVYCLNWLSVVLVVIGKICLLGVFVMLTTLFTCSMSLCSKNYVENLLQICH